MWTSHSYYVKTPLMDGRIHHAFIQEIEVCLPRGQVGMRGMRVGFLSSYSRDSGLHRMNSHDDIFYVHTKSHISKKSE
jgi:hypothetical protein